MKVLVVDIAGITKAIARNLKNLHYEDLEIETAQNVSKLTAESGIFDLLIIDPVMLGENASEKLLSIRDNNPQMKIVIVLASHSAEYNQLLKTFPSLDKPFKSEDLKVAIAKALEAQS